MSDAEPFDYNTVILVAGKEDWDQAIAAGWDPRNILTPKPEVIEGRRYTRMHITWYAFSVLADTDSWDFVARLSSNAVLSGATTTIGNVVAPEELT